LPRGETSKSPSRVSLQVGQAKRVTFSGALQSGQRALEMSIDARLNTRIMRHKINKVNRQIKIIDIWTKSLSQSPFGAPEALGGYLLSESRRNHVLRVEL
jgi:hypothetical protein